MVHPDTAGGRCAGVRVGLVLQQLPEGGAVCTREAKAPRAWRQPTEALGTQCPCSTTKVLPSRRDRGKRSQGPEVPGTRNGEAQETQNEIPSQTQFCPRGGALHSTCTDSRKGQRRNPALVTKDQNPGVERWRGEDNLKGRIT